mmetsp:Transcript_30869/g.50131  ORF Transcript_30869/g.50131 Transcript_30869/m.50131 type:complete len:219 (+) Transcript_30869:621-1277(+)
MSASDNLVVMERNADKLDFPNCLLVVPQVLLHRHILEVCAPHKLVYDFLLRVEKADVISRDTEAVLNDHRSLTRLARQFVVSAQQLRFARANIPAALAQQGAVAVVVKAAAPFKRGRSMHTRHEPMQTRLIGEDIRPLFAGNGERDIFQVLLAYCLLNHAHSPLHVWICFPKKSYANLSVRVHLQVAVDGDGQLPHKKLVIRQILEGRVDPALDPQKL